MAYCVQCGGDVPTGAKFCPTCGSAQGDNEAERESESKEVAASEEQRTSLPPGARVSRVRLVTYIIVAAGMIAGSLVYGLEPVHIEAEALEEESRELVSDLSEKNASAREEAAAQLARYQFCKRRTAPLLRELNDLGSRLDVGLAFVEYGEQVGDISVAYSRLRPGSLGPDCLKVAVPFESAYRRYAAAYNIWNDCIGDFGCSTDSIESQLQSKWLEADAAVSRGQRALAVMR